MLRMPEEKGFACFADWRAAVLTKSVSGRGSYSITGQRLWGYQSLAAPTWHLNLRKNNKLGSVCDIPQSKLHGSIGLEQEYECAFVLTSIVRYEAEGAHRRALA